MDGVSVRRRRRGRGFAAYLLGMATVASSAVLGNSHAARAWSVVTPVLPRSGASDGYEISTVPTNVQAQAIAIDPGTRNVFVGSDKLLSVLDERTGQQLGTVTLPGSVVALAVDTLTHRVYALQRFPQPPPVSGQNTTGMQSSIAVIDPLGLSVITTYPNLGYGPPFESTGNVLVDDPAGHRLFNAGVNATLNSQFVEGATQIDTVTGTATAVASGYEPNALAYDPSTQELYVADRGPSGSVTILSVKGAPRDITSAQVGQVAYGIAVDPSTQSVYVANSSGPSVSVISGISDKVVKTVAAGAIVSSVGVDTSSHTVFVTNGADGNVTVIDGATNTVTGTIQVGTPQYNVAVDPDTHSVWTTSSQSTSVTALNPIAPRFAGADRFATAVAISANEYPAGLASAVVLARADTFPDALVGAPLAAAKNAPLLFTSGTTLPAVTAAEIHRVLPPGKVVYVLGGPSAIPNQIVAQLTALGYSPIRLAGRDRYATAVAIADALGDPTTIFLASGSDFADALTAGPPAAQAHGAILLTSPGGVAITTNTYLLAHPGTVFAIGGPAAAADPAATPIFASDRFATSAAVAEQFFAAAQHAGVASGVTFPDALAAGAYMAATGGPLLLTQPTGLSSSMTSYLAAFNTTFATVDIFGGSAALSAAVQTAASAVLATHGS